LITVWSQAVTNYICLRGEIFMAKEKQEQHNALGRAILALVAGLGRPMSISEIKEMLSTQGLNQRDVHNRVQAMIITGQLKLGPGLKIELAEPLPDRIRGDVDWARAEVGRADRQIEAGQARRVAAIASLITMSGRDFQ
jgi:hypothetical protein